MGQNAIEVIGLILLGFFVALITMGYLGYKYYIQIEGQVTKNNTYIQKNSDCEMTTRSELDVPIQECRIAGLVYGSPIPCYITPTPTKPVPHPCMIDIPGIGIGAGICTY